MRTNGSSMNWRAVVIAIVMLDQIVLLELIDQIHASNQQIIVFLRKVEFIMVGSKDNISQDELSNRVVAASDNAGQIVVDLCFEVRIAVEQFFQYFGCLKMLSRKILNDSFNCYFLPPQLFLLRAIMQKNSIPFLPSLSQKLLLGLRLKSGSLNHFINIPGRLIIVLDMPNDREELL